MKSSYFRAASLNSFFRNAFFTSFIFITGFTVLNAQKATDSTLHTVASVSYLGYHDDQLSFLLQYETATNEKYTVTINDAEGHALFNQSFSDKKFNKIFRTPSETGNLTFIISNAANKEEKKFQVSTERRMIEEFSITKAKQ